MKIAIQSKKPLPFNPVTGLQGKIVIEIDRFDLVTNDLRILDSCLDENNLVVGNRTRFRNYPDGVLSAIFNALGQDILSTENIMEKFRELLQQGLLIETMQNPIYFSEANDWELYTEPIPTINPIGGADV